MADVEYIEETLGLAFSFLLMGFTNAAIHLMQEITAYLINLLGESYED